MNNRQFDQLNSHFDHLRMTKDVIYCLNLCTNVQKRIFPAQKMLFLRKNTYLCKKNKPTI